MEYSTQYDYKDHCCKEVGEKFLACNDQIRTGHECNNQIRSCFWTLLPASYIFSSWNFVAEELFLYTNIADLGINQNTDISNLLFVLIN